jgi:uncharacterized metal-binding protein YceD (DUF177 family)
MTPASVGPLSRPVAITDLPPEGVDVTVEASPEERAALAQDFKLPAIHALSGTYHLSGSPRRVRVSGRVAARVSQICVVTLEPFDADVEEEVAVDFAAIDAGARPDPEEPLDEEADAIVDGTIDLGALTAEFLALGLDPYPRKPGADFSYQPDEGRPASPFAVLRKPKGDR